MIAGGYTQDETIFVNRLRGLLDDIQYTAPILAYYDADSFEPPRIFQIFVWPVSLTIGKNGKVTAVSYANSYLSVLLDSLAPPFDSSKRRRQSYALILNNSFEVLAEYEI